ncbi:MAG: hypothetical protein HC802_22080, partial [Caldilineaceae bacterium]|nr:hypothetical protein [Caldilineaceae bacterium]
MALDVKDENGDESLSNRYVVVVTSRGVVQPVPIEEIPAMGRAVLGKQLIKPPSGTTIAVVQQVMASPQVVATNGQDDKVTPVITVESEAGDENPMDGKLEAAATNQTSAPTRRASTKSTRATPKSAASTPRTRASSAKNGTDKTDDGETENARATTSQKR